MEKEEKELLSAKNQPVCQVNISSFNILRCSSASDRRDTGGNYNHYVTKD